MVRKSRKKRGGYAHGLSREQVQRQIRQERIRRENREREAEERRRREEEQRNRALIARANRLVHNRTITTVEDAREVIDNHERHQRFMHNIIPLAEEIPVANIVNEDQRRSIFSRIPAAREANEGIPMAIESKTQTAGRKKKYKRRRRKTRKKRGGFHLITMGLLAALYKGKKKKKRKRKTRKKK